MSRFMQGFIRSLPLLTGIIGSLSYSSIHAQPGDLDASCGVNGIVTMNMFQNGTVKSEDYINFVKANGNKIYVGGGASDPFATNYSTGFLIARLNSDGTPDSGFGNAGRVLTHLGAWMDGASDMVVSSTGVMMAGYTASLFGSKAAVVSLDSTGAPNPGFGNGGQVILNIGSSSNATRILQQSDGKLIVAGYTRASSFGPETAFVARLMSDGTLDTGFGDSGVVSMPFGSDHLSSRINALATKSVSGVTDRIMVAGLTNTGGLDRFTVARLDMDGSLDTTFSGTGVSILSAPIAGETGNTRASSLLFTNNVLFAAGSADNDSESASRSVVIRFNDDGSFNSDFSQAGMFVGRYESPPGSMFHLIEDRSRAIVVTGSKVVDGAYSYSATRIFQEGGAIDDRFGWKGEISIPVAVDPAYGYAFANTSTAFQFTIGFVFPGGSVPGLTRILIAGKSVVNNSTDLVLAAVDGGSCE